MSYIFRNGISNICFFVLIKEMFNAYCSISTRTYSTHKVVNFIKNLFISIAMHDVTEYIIYHLFVSFHITIKIKSLNIYTIFLVNLWTYAYEKWPTTLENERKSAKVEIQFLRKICGLKVNIVTQMYWIKSYEEYSMSLGK